MAIPKEVERVLKTLQASGFEAYIVGGCVRDMLLGREPKDWDVTTNAAPEEIQKLFPKHFYNNTFGTVTVLLDSRLPSDSPGNTPPRTPPLGKGRGSTKEVEVTPYRTEAGYSDRRHPDEVAFTASLKEDLARRDFTINALAAIPTPSLPPGAEGLPLSKGEKASVVIDDLTVIDPFGGIKDLHAKVIRAVGEPKERFGEDALRLLRAVRFAAQLGFTIEEGTLAALKAQAESIRAVSQERIRDELIKIVESSRPELALKVLQETELLKYIVPELEEGVGVEQNKHHIYTVFEHNVKSLQFAAKYEYALPVRLAALFHDIGKPRTRRFDPKQQDNTFYGHDIVGARMTEKLMKRLRFPSGVVQHVSHLVRHHMFYYDMGKVTETGIRRLLRRVGKEYFDDLIKLRIAERKGSGVPKAEPYRLRHLQFMAEKVSQQPITVGQLKVRGDDLMKELKVKPGPVIGGILNALLAEVIEDPKRNEREYLLARAKELKDKDPAELKKLGAQAAEAEEEKRAAEIRRKYHV